MSYEASYWAIRQENIQPMAKFVLLVLADYHNSADGGCFPSIPTIAKVCCCDERTVQRAIKELCLAGLVEKNTRVNESGRQRSNQYNLILPQTLMGGIKSPTTPSNLSPLEQVSNNLTNTSYLHDPLLSIFENQSEEPPKIPDKEKSFWDDCRGGLMAMGMEDGHARKMIGRWLKQTRNDQAAVLDAINAALAIGTQDPVPYIMAVLGEGNTNSRKETDDIFAELREGHKKRLADWEAQGIIPPRDDTGDGGGDDLRVLQPEPPPEQTLVRAKRRRGPRKVQPVRPPEIVRPSGGYLGQVQVRPDDSGIGATGDKL